MVMERELLVAIFEAYEAWRCLKTVSDAGLSVAPSQDADVILVAQAKLEAFVQDVVDDAIARVTRSGIYNDD